MSDVAAGMWMVLCVMVFVRMRQWDKRFSAMYEDLKQKISEEFDNE